MRGRSITGDKDQNWHTLWLGELPFRTMKYNNHEYMAEERLRCLIASGTPLPPFLKDEAERIRAEIERGENSTHRSNN